MLSNINHYTTKLSQRSVSQDHLWRLCFVAGLPVGSISKSYAVSSPCSWRSDTPSEMLLSASRKVGAFRLTVVGAPPPLLVPTLLGGPPYWKVEGDSRTCWAALPIGRWRVAAGRLREVVWRRNNHCGEGKHAARL